MKIKTFWIILAGLILLGSCKQLNDQKVIYLAHTLPTSHPVHQGMEVFAQEVKTISEGKAVSYTHLTLPTIYSV